jgi:hypothetical protein
MLVFFLCDDLNFWIDSEENTESKEEFASAVNAFGD